MISVLMRGLLALSAVAWVSIHADTPLPMAWGENRTEASITEYKRLQEILNQVDTASKVDDQIALLKEAISIGASIPEWTLSIPRETWLALLTESLGKRYLGRVGGDRAADIDDAINAFEAARNALDPNRHTRIWIETHMLLGGAYLKRPRGDRQENLQKAIQAFEPVLTVLKQQDSPNSWASLMSNLGYAYSQLNVGNRESNAEHAITYLEAAEAMVMKHRGTLAWAGDQTNLSVAYAKRILGNRVDNLQKAIAANNAALTVYTRTANPGQWALNQGHLGKNLLNLAEAKRDVAKDYADVSAIIGKAVEALEAALSVTTRDEDLEQWASLQVALASAYHRNFLGSREENVNKAITAYENFLSAVSEQSGSQRWAEAQAQLGLLYLEARAKSEEDLVERAIPAFTAAETFYRPDTSPEGWAQVQANLGLAYYLRKKGERADNLEFAINNFETALTVPTPSKQIQQRGSTHNNLGVALLARIKGDRMANIERALASFNAALTVRTRDTVPELWAETQSNLATAYLERLSGDRGQNIDLAISSCRAAQTVFTKLSRLEQWAKIELRIANMLLEHPRDRPNNIEVAIATLQGVSGVFTGDLHEETWAYLQARLGDAYRDRYIGPRAANLEESIARFEAALSVIRRETSPHLWAKTMVGLGLTYADQIRGLPGENIKTALVAYEQALSVHTREAWPIDWAQIQNNRGLSLLKHVDGDRAQNIDDAIEAFRNAIVIYADQPSRRLWAETQSNLGLALTSRIRGSRAENIELAIAAYESALSVTTLAEFPDFWATLQGNLANARLERIHGLTADNIDDAIRGYEEALRVHTKDKYPEDWARLQVNLGGAFQSRFWGVHSENFERAITAYEEALTVLTHEGSPEQWAFASMHLGHAYRGRVLGNADNNLNKALAAYEDAATVYTAEERPDGWALLQSNIAYAYLARPGARESNYEEARRRFSAALEHIRADTRPREYMRIIHSLGNIMAAHSQWKEALEHYEAGIATFRFLFDTGLDQTDARDVIENAGWLFADAAYAAAKLGDLKQAFMLLEDGKARLLGLSLRVEALPLTTEQRVRRDELTARIRDADRSYQARVGVARSASLTMQKTLRQELAELIRAVQHTGAQSTNGGSVDRIAEFLGKGRVIIAPVVTDQGGIILVALVQGTTTKFSVIDAPHLTRRGLDELSFGADGAGKPGGWFGAYFANYLSRYEHRQEWKKWLDAIEGLGPSLWHLLGQALAEGLAPQGIVHGTELVFIPQGTLGILPVGLAYDSTRNRRLMDDYGVTYVPSLTALAAIHDGLQAYRPKALATLAAIINPTSDLKFSAIEGALIESHFARDGTMILKEDKATLDAVLSSLKGHEYWHFASHGKFNWMDPRASGLLLKNKEILSVSLLLRSYGLGRPRLVVLSACETGLHDTFKTPEEFSGLPAAFVQLGATAVLSTLWPVDDLSTALLMSKFYDLHRDQGLEPASALQIAQSWLREASLETLREYAREAVKAGRLSSDMAGTLIHLRTSPDEPEDFPIESSRVQPSVRKSPEIAPKSSSHQRPFEHPLFWGGFILTGR